MEMFDKIVEGKIKALYIFGEDPFITLPNLERLRNGLRQLEFLVVQDTFMTHVGDYAQVILPGVSFAEKDGTFTSMERRVQRVRKAIDPVGDSRPDWKIFCDLSTRMGYRWTIRILPMSWRDRFSGSSLQRDFIRVLKGRVQWSRPDGEKRFFPVEYRELVEQPNEQYPLRILARGFHYHYGIGTNIKRAEGLAKVFPDSCIDIHPEDAQAAGVGNGDKVRVSSPRGEVETVCRISEDLPKGMAYFASTFFSTFVNNLLTTTCDPISHNPEYKVFIGKVEKQ
jgi:predicted molibdopterin-dependent oxidoreductase YjgC